MNLLSHSNLYAGTPSDGSSPYPTNAGWAQAGSNLGTALFGNPQMAAQARLQAAEQQNYAAEAARAQQEAALYTARTAGETQKNTARAGLTASFGPVLGGVLQGNDSNSPESVPKGLAAAQFYAGATGTPNIYAPPAAGGAPAIVAPPTEDQSRGLAAAMGGMPTDTSAFTSAYGDKYQGAELANKTNIEAGHDTARIKDAGIQANASEYGARQSAGAAVQSAQLHVGAEDRATIARSADSHYSTDHGSEEGGQKISVASARDITKIVNDRYPDLPAALAGAVANRAVDDYRMSGNANAAVDQAYGEAVQSQPNTGWFGGKATYTARPSNSVIRYDAKGNRLP